GHLSGGEEVGAVGDQRRLLADDPVLRHPAQEAGRRAAAPSLGGGLRRRADADPLRGRRGPRRGHLRSRRRHLGDDDALPSGPRHLCDSGCALVRPRPAPDPLGTPRHRRDRSARVAGRVRAEEDPGSGRRAVRRLSVTVAGRLGTARDRRGTVLPPGDLGMTSCVLLRSALAVLLPAGLALGPGVFGPAQAADQVTLALDWIVNGTHAGYFVALDKGFYAGNNLDVSIARGYGSGDTIKRLAAGRANFAV